MLKNEREILDRAIEKFAEYKGIKPSDVNCPGWVRKYDWNPHRGRVVTRLTTIEDHKTCFSLAIKKEFNIEFGCIDIGEYSNALFQKGDLSKILARHVKHLRENDDIVAPILPQETIDLVLDNTVGFSKLKSKDLKLTRGILLYGPPGNGKTSLTRYVKNLFDKKGKTVVHASSIADLSRKRNGASNPFHMVGGGLIIVDDVDINVFNRKAAGAAACELLAQLDSIEKSSKPTVYIFSTNEKTADIDPAFLRPGRIDVKVSITTPDEELRRRFVNSWKDDIKEHIDTEDIVGKTDEWSFVEIEEIKQQIGMKLLLKKKPEIDWGQIREIKQERKVGFGA